MNAIPGLRSAAARAALFRGLFALAALGVAGCSTPAARIQANPGAFRRLPAEQQALVRNGQVALGFDEEAVKLALGDPDRITQRTDPDGSRTIWHYLTYEADGHVLYTGTYYTGRRWWGWGPPYPYYYLDYPNRRIRDRFRVEFRDGRVSAVTEERDT